MMFTQYNYAAWGLSWDWLVKGLDLEVILKTNRVSGKKKFVKIEGQIPFKETRGLTTSSFNSNEIIHYPIKEFCA